MAQTSRLVIEIDSRDAEAKAADTHKALEDAGLGIQPALNGRHLSAPRSANHKNVALTCHKYGRPEVNAGNPVFKDWQSRRCFCRKPPIHQRPVCENNPMNDAKSSPNGPVVETPHEWPTITASPPLTNSPNTKLPSSP